MHSRDCIILHDKKNSLFLAVYMILIMNVLRHIFACKSLRNKFVKPFASQRDNKNYKFYFVGHKGLYGLFKSYRDSVIDEQYEINRF